METVKYNVSKMDKENLITTWLDPKVKTETVNGMITNRQWCEDELKRIIKKGKKAICVESTNGNIALLRV